MENMDDLPGNDQHEPSVYTKSPAYKKMLELPRKSPMRMLAPHRDKDLSKETIEYNHER